MASILIADDEPRISGFLDKGLRAAGFATHVAHTGPEALQLAQTDEFDLLVLDVNLPGLDGFAVLEQLRGSGSQLPVIMLTARVDLADTVAGLQGGADDYLGKPFRFDELSAREFAIAEELVRNPGMVLSREQLLSRVWGYAFDPGSNVVEVHVSHLRNKLGAARIETVRGVGYRLV